MLVIQLPYYLIYSTYTVQSRSSTVFLLLVLPHSTSFGFGHLPRRRHHTFSYGNVHLSTTHETFLIWRLSGIYIGLKFFGLRRMVLYIYNIHLHSYSTTSPLLHAGGYEPYQTYYLCSCALCTYASDLWLGHFLLANVYSREDHCLLWSR